MGFMDGFERGLSGNYRYEIAGKAVVCSHCGGEEFDERSGQLNTAGASLLNLDWANATARACMPKLRSFGMVSLGGAWIPNSST